jgi:hypothetical protein
MDKADFWKKSLRAPAWLLVFFKLKYYNIDVVEKTGGEGPISWRKPRRRGG